MRAINLRTKSHCVRLTALAACAMCAWMACAPLTADAAIPTSADRSTPAATIAMSLVGWPNISGLDVLADGQVVVPSNGVYTVDSDSKITFQAGGVTLAVLSAKANVTLFDLLPAHACESSTDLAKLLSLLFSLDTDQNPGNGIAIGAVATPAQNVLLSDLSEADLLALEVQLSGRSTPLLSALLASDAALDAESWTESLATRTSFINDMSVLQSYLDRVLGAFALDANLLDGFAYLAPSEVASVPATLKNEGVAFDGATPVFSWRYGLQRTDAATYAPTLAYPFALPVDIQAIYTTLGNRPDYGHIGDIDIAGGKLYAPIEDEDNSQLQSFIAVYDAATLQYTGEKHALPLALHADGVPWVAVDAARNQFYTVTWSTSAADSVNVFDLSTFALIRSVPLQMSFNGRRVQGAKVFDGMLYASGDSHDAGSAPGTNRKYVYKVDTFSGSVTTLWSYDEPNRTESEGLAFDPNGTMHLIVLAPYTTPLYASGTHNPKPFDGSYSIDGDDWNPSATLRHYTRDAEPLRDQLCRM